MSTQSTPSPGTLVVLGSGRAGAAPDTLVLDLQLEGRGATVPDALDALTHASRACHDALPGTSLRTSGLGVHARHDHHGAGEVVGYTASQSLSLRTSDTSGAGDLVQRLSQAVGDALGVHGLRGELTDTAALEARARELAFADARSRAEQYAALAGRGLGRVVAVREVPEGPVHPYPRAALAAMDAGPVVTAADQEVAVTVEVTWELDA